MQTDGEKLVEIDQRSKSNTHRINQLEENQSAIQNMALAVRELAVQMGYMKDEQAEQNQRITAIEKEPKEQLHTIYKAIVSALAGSVITALVGAALLYVK